MRLEVSGGRPSDQRRVRRVFVLSAPSQAWLAERLHEQTPELARRLALAHPRDLVIVGRRDELPVLRRLLDEQAAALSPQLAEIRTTASAAAKAEHAAAAAQPRGRQKRRR